jgi:hypothetical protein
MRPERSRDPGLTDSGKKSSGDLSGRIGLLPFSQGIGLGAEALGWALPARWAGWIGHLKVSAFDAVRTMPSKGFAREAR